MSNVTVLNDLIEINNDRVAGFEKAVSDIKDENIDLKEIFLGYASQSRQFAQELSAEVGKLGGDVETDNSVSGTLHRAWIDIKALFTGGDRTSILNEAERGEDAIKAAYQNALSAENLSLEHRELIKAQAQKINDGHDAIKALRDLARKAD
ncbi:PA2169 family four-helix-bundle protein [Sphingobacterium corticis]|uniref:PA2169 family four-helix-bundle protein n=1 Tax=Sphingobacterium corticis TaxID=1812823 RepID=A0ABW5NLH5_9SPHI